MPEENPKKKLKPRYHMRYINTKHFQKLIAVYPEIVNHSARGTYMYPWISEFTGTSSES